MGLLTINQFQILAFTLVFLRCLAFFVSWPIFSGTNLPVQVKVLLSLLVGMICFSLIPPESYPKIEAYPTMIGLGIKEMAIGFAIGFLANLILVLEFPIELMHL